MSTRCTSPVCVIKIIGHVTCMYKKPFECDELVYWAFKNVDKNYGFEMDCLDSLIQREYGVNVTENDPLVWVFDEMLWSHIWMKIN